MASFFSIEEAKHNHAKPQQGRTSGLNMGFGIVARVTI